MQAGPGVWIAKQDGSPETAVEAFKGGLSKALVRVAAAGYCIGRYLYNLPESFADCVWYERGMEVQAHQVRARIDGKPALWAPPALPEWALPSAGDAELLEAFADANGRFGARKEGG